MWILRENFKGAKPKHETRLDISKEGNKLIFSFLSIDCSMHSYSNIYNDKIYLGDVVEIFMYIGQKDHYIEIEVAPNGTMFFANIYNPSILTSSELLPSLGLSSKVENTDEGLFTKIELDISRFDIDLNDIEFNAFRIETEGLEPDKNLYSLNPTLCETFHVRDKFVKLKDFLK